MKRISAVVLAAGASSRMGECKLTLPYGGKTVLETVLDELEVAEIAEILVVLGHHADLVVPLVSRRARLVTNPFPDNGMLSSVHCGVRAASPSADTFLIVLGDQPAITAAGVTNLLARASDHNGIAVPSHAGRRGHPILISATMREAILALPLTVGLNELIRRNAQDVLIVPMDDDAWVLEDMDTPEDYARAVAQSGDAVDPLE